MALDIRATTTCNLGPLISANIADDYLQLNGLIKTQGDCVIKGIINPRIGDIVTFQYTRNGVTRSIPKRLRVLSFFCDPYEKITTVTLGCKLTYLSDLREPISWSQFDDPENQNEEPSEIIVFPIRASSVMNYCLGALGILSTDIPLTNRFSVAEFDFSPGYVQILSDLLVSEGYFGYLNENETLVVKSLAAPISTAPVLSADEIISIGEVNSGQLPGENVVVSYSSLRLNAPDGDEDDEEEDLVNWDYSREIGKSQDYELTVKNRDGEEFELKWTYAPWSEEFTEYDAWDRVTKKTKTSYNINVDFASGFISDSVASCFGGLNEFTARNYGGGVYETKEITTIRYRLSANSAIKKKPDGYDDVLFEITETIEPEGKVHSGLQYNFTSQLGGFFVVSFEAFVGSDKTTRYRQVQYEKANVKNQVFPSRLSPLSASAASSYPSNRTTTVEYVAYGYTSRGQTYISKATENGQRFSLLKGKALDLVFEGGSTQIVTGRQIGLQERASKESRILDGASAEDVDPNNGFSTTSQASLELVFGDAQARRRVEFTLPYAPDDTFFRTAIGIDPENGQILYNYGSIPSDAPSKARYFGRIQSRLLLGNRNGMNIQTTPENIPLKPFSRFAITAQGVTGLYATNAVSWTIDASGIIVSTDAMFWQPVGGSGDAWFPTSPGTTGLPPAPSSFILSPNILGSVQNVYA